MQCAEKIHNAIVQMKCNVYNLMYSIQIILAHNKQTHYQPPFPKNMEFLKKFINKQILKKRSNKSLSIIKAKHYQANESKQETKKKPKITHIMNKMF